MRRMKSYLIIAEVPPDFRSVRIRRDNVGGLVSQTNQPIHIEHALMTSNSSCIGTKRGKERNKGVLVAACTGNKD